MENLNPKIWGRYGWKFMHYVTLSYPDNPTSEDKQDMINFFYSVGRILPCMSCRINFKKHLDETPLTEQVLGSRENIVIWLMNIHNKVNAMQGKKIYTLHDLHKEYYKRLVSNENRTFFLLMLIIFIILIVVFVVKYRLNRRLVE